MPGLSRKVAERIARRAAVDRIVVVVFGKNRLARVFGFEEYLKMKELPRKVKPWARRVRRGAVDPLGAVPGKVRSSLGRNEIYGRADVAALLDSNVLVHAAVSGSPLHEVARAAGRQGLYGVGAGGERNTHTLLEGRP